MMNRARWKHELINELSELYPTLNTSLLQQLDQLFNQHWDLYTCKCKQELSMLFAIASTAIEKSADFAVWLESGYLASYLDVLLMRLAYLQGSYLTPTVLAKVLPVLDMFKAKDIILLNSKTRSANQLLSALQKVNTDLQASTDKFNDAFEYITGTLAKNSLFNRIGRGIDRQVHFRPVLLKA